MRYAVLGLFLAALPASSMADEPPPPPEGGLTFIADAPCTNNETGAKGHCYISVDKQGNQYLAFYQGDIIMFIRKVVGDDYETVWERAPGVGV